MRNTSTDQRGAWATFAKAARESAGLSQTELARRLNVERTTIWRWETGRQKPESVDIVAAFARELAIDAEEALAAASLKLDVEPPTEPTRDPDPEIEAILTAPVSDVQKKRMLELLFQMRERDKQRRMEDIAFLLDRDGRR